MTDLKPFIDALKAAFNDDAGFLDSNYTDIGDDDVSRVVLDGEWDFADTSRDLYDRGLPGPAPLREEWGIQWDDGVWEYYRSRAEAEVEAGDEGALVHRYVSDWMPVDRAEGDGSADQ